MKPMPASRMQAPTCSALRSILTPSAPQHVGGAGLRRQRAIAVLGDRHAGAGDDERGAGRDVERAGGVAAGADHVDRVGRRFHAQHLGAHGGDRAGDLVDGFAAHAQRHQQRAHLRGRRFARHHAVEGAGCFRAREARAGRDLGDERFEIVGHGREPSTGRVGGRLARRRYARLPAALLVPGGGEIEEILQHQMAVLGGDALGMELHAVHGQARMRQRPSPDDRRSRH